jgi:hypothetical protein
MVGRGLAVAEGRKTAGKGIECKVHLDPTYSKEPSFLPQMLQLQGVEVESSSAFLMPCSQSSSSFLRLPRTPACIPPLEWRARD